MIWVMNSKGQQELVVGYFTASLQHIPVGSEKNHEYLPRYSACAKSDSYWDYPNSQPCSVQNTETLFPVSGSENPCTSKNKVKPSLCLIKHHAVCRRMGEWRDIDLRILTSVLVGCVWSASRLGRFTPGERTPIVKEAGRAPEPAWTIRKREKSLAAASNRSAITLLWLVAIRAELSRPLFFSTWKQKWRI
jgi:hypothetical protein